MTRDIHFVGITASDPADYKNFSPIAFALLAAYLREHLPFVRVSLAENARKALDLSPDIVGISSTSVNFGLAARIARELKKAADLPVLVGGIHISLLPKTLPEEMDVGVLGEGERTVVDLLDLFSTEGRLAPERLKAVDGICFHGPGDVAVTPKRTLIENLDSLPHPDRKLIGVDPDRAHIVASRGCPYHCSFCSSKAFWGSYRTHGVPWVMEEIRILVEEYQARSIHFYDDLFAVDRKRLKQIAEEIVRRGYPGKVNFSLALRAETADEELFDLLAAMGVGQVTFGAESNSPRILTYLKGDGADPKANQRLVDLAFRRGIGVSPSFIKGAPEETGNDLMETYRFLIENIREKKISYFEIHNLTPFPGTRVWDEALEMGLVSQTMDWEMLRTPWERLYMNRQIPKAGFYFFETLTRQAEQMLGIFCRELVCIVDQKPGSRQVGFEAEIRQDGFFDRVLPVDLSGEKPPDLSELESLAEHPDRPFLFCYCRPGNSIDLDALKRFCWHAFLSRADYVVHAGWRHFSPVTDFERSLRALSFKGLRAVLPLLQTDPFETELEKLGLKVVVYRPDLDPFTPTGPVERLFTETLSADFKLDRFKQERDKRLAIVEERIIEKSERLPERENRNRRWRSGRIGQYIRESRSKTLKKIVRFLLERD